MRRGSDWCALAVFRALFPRVSLGGPGNLSLGLPHVPSELRGVGFSQFSVLVTNVPPWVRLVVVDLVRVDVITLGLGFG